MIQLEDVVLQEDYIEEVKVPVILLGIIFSFLERETKSSRKSTRIETW
jgi:hypothetical protein